MSRLALQVPVTLESLKAFVAEQTHSSGYERYPFESYRPGIPQGALVEVSGPAKTAAVLRFLKQHPALRVLWLEPRFTLFPPHVRQLGVENRIAFVETESEVYSSLRLALRSGIFHSVVTTATFEEELYKNLRFLSEKSKVATFLLCKTHQSSWSVALHLEASWGASPDCPVVIDGLRDKCSNSALVSGRTLEA